MGELREAHVWLANGSTEHGGFALTDDADQCLDLQKPWVAGQASFSGIVPTTRQAFVWGSYSIKSPTTFRGG